MARTGPRGKRDRSGRFVKKERVKKEEPVVPQEEAEPIRQEPQPAPQEEAPMEQEPQDLGEIQIVREQVTLYSDDEDDDYDEPSSPMPYPLPRTIPKHGTPPPSPTPQPLFKESPPPYDYHLLGIIPRGTSPVTRSPQPPASPSPEPVYHHVDEVEDVEPVSIAEVMGVELHHGSRLWTVRGDRAGRKEYVSYGLLDGHGKQKVRDFIQNLRRSPRDDE